MLLVIDNTVECSQFPCNQSTGCTDTIVNRLRGGTTIAPALWPLKLVNVLRTTYKLRAMKVLQASGVVVQHGALHITVDASPPTAEPALALVLRYDLSSYDVEYLPPLAPAMPDSGAGCCAEPCRMGGRIERCCSSCGAVTAPQRRF